MFGKKLRELRKLEGWKQEEVAKKIGVTKQTYSHYENETRTPSLGTIRKLAEVYGVDLDTVFGTDDSPEIKEKGNVYTVPSFKSVPIVGQISCGNGVLAYEDIEGYEDVPSSWLNGGKYFFLRAKGDSMINARIHDGDLVLIREQPEVEDGEIAAVLIDGDAVLKRVYKQENGINLVSENPAYPTKFYSEGVQILGKLKKIFINV
ncbi:LexA family protein [Bacillus litorisediminis]|uniref:LexA family protein n=1 Tax=Bacillus litorisediminis TaxID=2922713 RepID=UPI001FACC476|nr:XRE family transcriptional regulator [Bacillus litorisediminis]